MPEELGYEEANWGVDTSDGELVFPTKPPVEATPDGGVRENRPGAARGPEFVNLSYQITGRTIMAVCNMIDKGRTDDAIATLSTLAPINATAGEKVNEVLNVEG